MLKPLALLLCGTVLAAAFAIPPAHAGTYTPLYQFTGGTDGAMPSAALTYDEKGNVYGVDEYGGVPCQSFNYYGCGTVYKLSPSGQETTLVIFNDANGQYPQGQLTLIDHTLYGSTYSGGDGGDAAGVLFSVHTDGTHFKWLHVFHGATYRRDGGLPRGPLVPGSAGVLYGFTQGGGLYNQGVLFELMPDGTYIPLHSFSGVADGSDPISLVSDAAGTLYGSTFGGGTGCPGKTQCGVVYQYVPSTAAFTVLHAFAPGEGRTPMLGSIGADGTLYGATKYGPRPAPNGFGSLFELTPSGGVYSLTTLYSFPGSVDSAGAYPTGGPTLTRSGALIGTTTIGGPAEGGTLYRYKFNRMETLYAFPLYSAPVPPTLGNGGIIYGATAGGGIIPCNTPGFQLYSGCGVTYSFLQ